MKLLEGCADSVWQMTATSLDAIPYNIGYLYQNLEYFLKVSLILSDNINALRLHKPQ